MRPLILLILSCLSPSLLSAEPVQLVGQVIDEAESNRALISKPSWLRGLHILGTTPVSSSQPVLRAVIPKDWSGQDFCARITSIGGDYTATAQFEAPSSLATNLDADLAFRPKIAVRADVTPENSGVSLELGACEEQAQDGAAQRRFIASYWNEESEPKLSDTKMAQMVLNMNIARADELEFDAVLNDVRLNERCEKLDDPKALAFNYRCFIDVPLASLTAQNSETINVSYTRLYRGRASAPRRADIQIGAGQ